MFVWVSRPATAGPSPGRSPSGRCAAKRWLLTGDPVPADEAERLGFGHRVVADDRIRRAVRWPSRNAWQPAPRSPCKHTKQAVNKLIKAGLTTGFDLATALEIDTFRSDDHAEALAALRDKRQPRFEGH